MRNKIILLFINLISTFAIAQTNLIQDPGFENDWTYWTPEDDDDAEFCYNFSSSSGYVESWSFGQYWNNPILVSIEPPNVYFGEQYCFEGTKYAGIMAYHNAQANLCCGSKAKIGYHLPNSLDPEKEYVLTFRVSKMDNSTRQPYLNVYVNQDFSDDWGGGTEVVKQYITEDGSPSNTDWKVIHVVFSPSNNGNDWLIFKMSNDLIFEGSEWTGVYLDDVHLYEYCDYQAASNNSGCLQSNGNIVVVGEPILDNQYPYVYYHWFDDPFHIRNLQNVSNVRMKIYTYGLVLVKTIELASKNGIWENVYWDGRNEAGGEQAAGYYFAEVESWNGGLTYCNYNFKRFYFQKVNGNADPDFYTLYTMTVNDLTHGGTIDLQGPPAFNWCCSYMPNLSLNNLHYKANDLGSYNNIGIYYYKALNQITFGPNVIVDQGATVSMTAPKIITVTSGSSLQGNVQLQLMPCNQRLSNPDIPFKNENDFLLPDSNTLSSLDLESLIHRIRNNEQKYILYPNPTSDGKANVFLKEGGFKDISIGIYNSIGECVQFSSAPISGEFLIDLSSKSTGLYLIKIFEPKSTQVLKLIYEDGK